MSETLNLKDGDIVTDTVQPYIFGLVIKVRDYETDSQGIVNNANYLHYMEMTRHAFCQWRGYSFAQMMADGITAVLRKVEIEYISSLHGGDIFVSYLWLERSGPRFIFHQDLYNLSGTPVVKAIATVVATHHGHITKGDELAVKLTV